MKSYNWLDISVLMSGLAMVSIILYFCGVFSYNRMSCFCLPLIALAWVCGKKANFERIKEKNKQ